MIVTIRVQMADKAMEFDVEVEAKNRLAAAKSVQATLRSKKVASTMRSDGVVLVAAR